MPIKEECTKQIVMVAFDNQNIANVTPVLGVTVDTANYDNGVYFALYCTAFTTGQAALTFYESDDSGMSGKTAVATKNLVRGTACTVGNALTEGEFLATEGVFGTKRYIQVEVTGSDTPSLYVTVLCIKNPEIAPTLQNSTT